MKQAGSAAEPAEPGMRAAASARPMHGELLERVLERENLQRALKQVRRNQGAPGVDGMSVDELPEYLRHHWPKIKCDIMAQRYRPQPVRRVEIPKRDGRKRMLGIPTVLDRFIQQTIAQVVQARWEPHFHPHSYGFRPQRSAQQAVRKLQTDVKSGYDWVVDLVAELRDTLLGWKAYFGITEVLSPLRELDKWIRRRLRCYAWKQWGSRGYRELRQRGVSVREAWNVSKSAHGPWRISKTPALSAAMPTSFFSAMGLPQLAPAKARSACIQRDEPPCT